jgi:hypothetical protein
MNTLHFTDINFYAVLAAWIIHTATGLLWFQPKLFGNEWSKGYFRVHPGRMTMN